MYTRSTKVVTAHVTENFQLKAADQLISNLRIQLGQNEEYIQELEETINNLRDQLNQKDKEIDKLKEKYQKIANRYSSDINQAVKLDDVYQKQSEKIKELCQRNRNLEQSRDQLIYQLNQLR